MRRWENAALVFVFLVGLVGGFFTGRENANQHEFNLGYEQRIIDERENWKMLDDNLKICQWVEVIKKEGKCQ